MTEVGEGERLAFIIASIIVILVVQFTEYASALPVIGVIAGLISNPISLIAMLVIANFIYPNLGLQLEKVIAIVLVAYSTMGVLIIFDYPLFSLVGIALAMLVTSFFFAAYQSSEGSISSLLITTIIVSALVYFAMGPWSPIVRRHVQMIKEPLNMATEMVKEKGEEMTLLVTDPRAYYARMQAKNAIPDDVEPPKGVEFNAIYPPKGLVWGEDTSTDIIIQNYGEADAKDVKVEFYCDTFKKAGYSLEQCEPGKTVLFERPVMRRKEVEVVSNSFKPKPVIRNDKSLQENLKVHYKLSYRYSTETNFQISIANPKEIKTYLIEGGDLRRVEPSYVDNAPAVLSLNAGLQPKYGDRDYQLIISVIKQRADGRVMLDSSTSITVWLEKKLTTVAPQCNSNIFSISVSEDSVGDSSFWKISMKPSQKLELKKSDILSTSCKLHAPLPENFKRISGIVLGRLENFEFENEESQILTVSIFGDVVPHEYFVSYLEEIEKKIAEGKAAEEKVKSSALDAYECIKSGRECAKKLWRDAKDIISESVEGVKTASDIVGRKLGLKKDYYLYAKQDLSPRKEPEGEIESYVKIENGKGREMEYIPKGSFVGKGTAFVLLEDKHSIAGVNPGYLMMWVKVRTWGMDRGFYQKDIWVHIANGIAKNIAGLDWKTETYFADVYVCPKLEIDTAKISKTTFMLDEKDINRDWLLSTDPAVKTVSSGSIKSLGDTKCIIIDSDVYVFQRVSYNGGKYYIATGRITDPTEFVEK